MTYVAGLPELSGPDRRTEIGERWSTLPPADGLLPVKVPQVPCADCAKRDGHGTPCRYMGYSPVHGETTLQRIAAANRITGGQANRVMAALWAASAIHNGRPPRELLDNAGEASDNPTQDIQYRIMSVGSRSLVLRGPNPKRIEMGKSRLNPEWPLPDPVTGSTARVIFEGRAFALPVGGTVHFLPPSALENKRRPWITRIEMPATNAATATFTVYLSASCEAAMEPRDAAFPAAEYHCLVRCYAFHPEEWPNYQERREQQVTRVVRVIEAAEAQVAPVELTGPSGSSCRVLWPDMTPGSGHLAARLLRTPTGGGPPVEVEDFADRLLTDQLAEGSWRTTLDLTDLAETNESFVVRYWATAVASTVERLPFAGMCANCQSDPTGSYVHHGGMRCTAAADADMLGTFRAGCWQPNCSRFALTDGASSYRGGNLVRPPTAIEDAGPLRRAWVGVSWVRVQELAGMNGGRGFRMVRPVGAMGSIGQLLGLWSVGVPNGMFAQRVPYHGAAIGRRVQYALESPEVGVGHYLVFGAFISRETWTAPAVPAAGFLPTHAAGWTSGRKDWRTAAETAVRARYPESPIGTHHMYDMNAEGSAYAQRTRLVPSESWVVGVDVTEVDEDLAELIRDVAAGS